MATKAIKLKTKNFDQVYKSEEFWFIQFYSPNCGACKSFKPQWKKLQKYMKGKNIKFGEVNGLKYPKLLEKNNIKKYPTLKFFYKDEKNTMIYIGDRNSKKILRYLIKKSKNNGKPLKNSNLQTKKENTSWWFF